MQYIILKDKYRISKITLGAAQLGLHYGVNSVGPPTKDEAFEILKYAFANGLNTIDTSPIYGSSEKRIGKFIQQNKIQKIFLITKLEAQNFPEEIWEDKKALSRKVERDLYLSFTNLKLIPISAYILHFADQAFKDKGIILSELAELKKKGYIEFIGTSLYTDEELKKCINDERIDIIQVPFSILDRRLLESGLLTKAKERGVIIFARSIYLQGLVFMDKLPSRLNSAKKIIDGLHRLANICNMSVNEVCLRYVLSINEISSVVIGVSTLEHMKKNIKIASLGPLNKNMLRKIEKLPQMPTELIDIRSWSPGYDFIRG